MDIKCQLPRSVSASRNSTVNIYLVMHKVILINPPLYFSQGRPQVLDVSVPPLGLMYLASYINTKSTQAIAGIMDVGVDDISLPEITRRIKAIDPIVVGVTTMTPQLQGVVELAEFLKRKLPQVTIVLGGPHVSADPGFMDRHPGLFDYTITGESEKTFLELVEKLSQNMRVPRVQSGEAITDLDSIPFPDRRLIKRERYSQYESMMFSRGCPYQCYYCSRPAISRTVRYRSVANLISEIKSVYKYCQGKIDFQDDTLTLDRDKVLEFCQKVKREKLKLHWRCNTRIDCVDDELLAAMGSAGCELIHFGIESGNEKVRREIVKKGSFSNIQVRAVISSCQRFGIKAAGYFIIGHPGETESDLADTKQLILNSGIDLLGVAIPTPFPGSALYEIAKERGVVSQEIIDRFARKELGEGYSGVYPVLTSEKVSREYVFSLMREINRKFYLTWRMFWRRFTEDVTSISRLRQDFLDLVSLIAKGMSSRKPYLEPDLRPDLLLDICRRRPDLLDRPKIVFVTAGVENLAVETLSSFLKKHDYNVELVFDSTLFSSEAVSLSKLADLFDTEKELAREILAKKPDLIGFSVFTLNYQRMVLLAREIKRLDKSIPIIFGGIHPTSVPERVMAQEAIDMVCVGEGEYALLELLESMEKGEERSDIQNIWFKREGEVIKNPCRPLVADLDRLPFPDKDLFYQVYPGFIKDDYYALSSRGCPFACTYCANSILHQVNRGLGQLVRRRSPENMVAELAWAKKRYSPKQVTFVDDVFVQSVEWLEKFVPLYKKEIGLPYVVLTHPRFVTPRIAQLLADSGCFLLMLGLQSASEEIRTKILNRFETNQEVSRAAKVCHQVGLKFSIDHIFNIPYEGLKEYEEAIRLYAELKPAVIHSYWLQYFPRAKIVDIGVEAGVIKASQIEEIEEGRTSTSWVVGVGGTDTFSPELIYTNFQFFFTLLPILPEWLVTKIINQRWYLAKIKPPMLFNVGLKFMINVINRRGSVYVGMVKSMVHFAKKALVLKWRYGFSQKYRWLFKKFKNLLTIPQSIYHYHQGSLSLPYLPNALWIEPTNVCNLKCIMCPNSIVAQKNPGYMSMDLYKKIIDESKDFAAYITLCISGESLLHPRFPDMVRYAKENGINTYLSTNCTTMTPELSEKILEAGLDWINFSFDGCSKEIYEKVRVGANFEQSLSNVAAFLKAKKRLGAKTHAELQVLVMGKEGMEDYKNNIAKFSANFADLPLDSIQVRRPSTWGGFLADTDKFEPRDLGDRYSPCSYLWSSLHVLWDGTIVACTSDFFADNVLGKFPEKSLREIWNDQPMQNFRKAMLNKQHLGFNKNCESCDSLFEKRILGLPAGIRGISALTVSGIFGKGVATFLKKMIGRTKSEFPMHILDQ